MKQETAKEIIACLPRERTLFHYHKDRYAAWLLGEIARQGVSIAELKRSPYARLLSRPLIKQLISAKGDGMLRADDFDYVWQEPSKTFMLTLDTWEGLEPEYDQTTRSGFNLVLQLNFSNEHNGYFHRMFPEELQDDLRSWGHPTLLPGDRDFRHETLAWARIDVDLDTGEALIEEIQNDWLRYARRWRKCLSHEKNCEYCYVQRYARSKHHKYRVLRYLEEVLSPYENLWSEAMLAATLWFIYSELGIQRIYYHEFESGARLKSIHGRKPPRSLYTQLPRQFCFQPRAEHPEFLLKDRYFKKQIRKHKNTDTQWQCLDLGANRVGDRATA